MTLQLFKTVLNFPLDYVMYKFINDLRHLPKIGVEGFVTEDTDGRLFRWMWLYSLYKNSHVRTNVLKLFTCIILNVV